MQLTIDEQVRLGMLPDRVGDTLDALYEEIESLKNEITSQYRRLELVEERAWNYAQALETIENGAARYTTAKQLKVLITNTIEGVEL